MLNPSAIFKGPADRSLDPNLLAALDLASPVPLDVAGVDLGSLVAGEFTGAGTVGALPEIPSQETAKPGGDLTLAGEEQGGGTVGDGEVDAMECRWLGDHTQWLIL